MASRIRSHAYTLDKVDEHFGATKVLIDFYESIDIELTTTWDRIAAIPSLLTRELARWERHLLNQAIRQTIRGH